MLKLSFSPKLVKPNLDEKLKKISKQQPPAFHTHQADFPSLEKAVKKYRKYKKLIVIGNGGSRASSLAYTTALRDHIDEKQVAFVNTPEPDYIKWIKARFSPKETLVMPISKSGTNVDSLAPLTAFMDYPIVAVTGLKGSVLYEIASKQMWDVIEHPEIGGRFSGTTNSCYAPLAFLKADLKEIDRGAKDMYAKCAPSVGINQNPALQLAVYFYHFDLHGYDEIYTQAYSTKLAGFLPQVIQVIHESSGKDGKGQTIYGDQGPECQHHTNQRFFGGKKNVIGWYWTVENLDAKKEKIKIPASLKKINLRGSQLGVYDGITYANALKFDYESNLTDATQRGIPHVVLTIDTVSPYTMGEFLGFLNYLAVYSAWLRDQDPFDQPEVERAKEIAFQMAKASLK